MQWEIVKGEEQGQILFAPGVTTQPSDKKKKETERKLIAGRVHDFDEVKKSIENQSRKQPTPPIEQLAALTPVNLPKQPTLATQEEEPILPLPEHARHKIKRKETLGKILQQIGVPAAETAQWVSIAKKVKEFRSLRPGEVLELSFTEDVEDRELQVITYQLGKDVRLVLEKHKDGSLEAKKIQPVAQPVFVVLGGSISKHLSSSVKKAGIPARFVTEMTKLDWDIDLGELRKGDSFKILLEAVQRGEEIVEYKRLLAAEVMNHGEVFTVFSIPEEKRRSRKEYLAEEYKGKGMQIQSGGQKFLPFPLEFSRMSSVFTESRFHPILRRSRPHNGVDLAAPYGTPVHAVASGRVTFIGRQSGYGNIVKIDHPGPYETGYAHLQQFAEGLTEGEKVEKGQLIGYVGSTGLATGPHLHFELLKEGVFVNPLAEKTSDGEPVKVANAVKEQKVDPMIEKKKQRFRDQLATLDVKKGIFVRQVLPQGTSTSVTASIEVEQLFSSRSRSAAASRRVRR
ncbi:MAG: peptidoglycan DD-metalloendopeptidase family protein [Candidatus Binatia bacterium]